MYWKLRDDELWEIRSPGGFNWMTQSCQPFYGLVWSGLKSQWFASSKKFFVNFSLELGGRSQNLRRWVVGGILKQLSRMSKAFLARTWPKFIFSWTINDSNFINVQLCNCDFPVTNLMGIYALMSFWRQFGPKWHQIRWKSYIIFLENAMEIPWVELNLSKILVILEHGKQIKPGQNME